MKKFVALLLAILLVMVNIAALADPETPTETPPEEEQQQDGDAVAAPEFSIKKTYTTTGTATNVYPTEELTFTVTPKAASYPTVTVGNANKLSVSGETNEYTIAVNVPAASVYGTAGKYHYTVKETGATTTSQAVGYDTTTTFNVDVYVYYATATGSTTPVLTRTAIIYSGDAELDTDATDEAKHDDFANTYSVGKLTVTKAIDGNLADPNKVFTIKVTLASTENVASELTIDGTNATSVTGNGNKNWKSKEITFTAKGGQSITIENIPTGVTYKVEEILTTRIDDEHTQLAMANDPDYYEVSGEVDTPTAIGTTPASETVTNTKKIDIPTGITLETLPYVLIMAIAMVGAVALFARKREEY